MIFVATSVDEESISLQSPAKVEVNKSLDAPADDLEVTFFIDSTIPEIKSIKAYNGKDLVFDGIVDVQEYKRNIKGTFLNLVARSKAALLLDNEACPQIYYTPSLFTIFNRHVKPYGFSKFIGDDRSFSAEFVVNKGTSEWEVLEDFCLDYLKIKPKITVDGVVDVSGESKNSCLLFSNTANDGIKYSAITLSDKRYKLYSEIYAKESEKGNYTLEVKSDAAKKRVIQRVRYLNLSNGVKSSLAYAEAMIKSAEKSTYEINLSCPQKISAEVGYLATLDEPLVDKLDNLFIYKVKYILDANLERTIITLRKEGR